MSVDYSLERQQFGQVIGQFQAVKHQLADMAMAMEPARALVWYAAHAFDVCLPDASRAASLAKAHLTDQCYEVARMAVQIHGGIGYTWEFLLHLWLRRAMFSRNLLGTPSLHRERAARLAGW
jgi:alkylation response protein AidB-like acyl-CoA dehydrogenase